MSREHSVVSSSREFRLFQGCTPRDVAPGMPGSSISRRHPPIAGQDEIHCLYILFKLRIANCLQVFSDLSYATH